MLERSIHRLHCITSSLSDNDTEFLVVFTQGQYQAFAHLTQANYLHLPRPKWQEEDALLDTAAARSTFPCLPGLHCWMHPQVHSAARSPGQQCWKEGALLGCCSLRKCPRGAPSHAHFFLSPTGSSGESPFNPF